MMRGALRSWLADWPLLVGLVLSASLIGASTAIGGSPDRPQPTLRRSPLAGAGSAQRKSRNRVVDVTGRSRRFASGASSYAFSAPSHQPVVGRPWRLRVSAERSGRPLAATVTIDVVHDGTIVSHAASGKLVKGRFAHDFPWPLTAAGIPLTVKTTVTGGGSQQTFLYDLEVKAAG